VSRPGGTERYPWMVPIAAAVFVSVARAVLIVAKDGYAAIGLYALAIHSASRHFLEGLVPALAVGLAFGLCFARWRGRSGGRLVVAAGLAVIAYLFIAGRLPPLPLHAPGFGGLRARAAHAGALLAAITAAALLARGSRLGTVLVRVVVGTAGVLTVTAASVLLLSFSSSRREGPSGARPNVILISLDTVRADHLSGYGYHLPTTPEIDRFFSDHAVRFEAAFAPQPWTLTSHLTMLTSLHPSVHGVSKDRGLPPGVRTLSQILAKDGYLTFGSVYDMLWMSQRYGFDRGFHIYRRFDGNAPERKAVVDALLDDLADERFFLFLHYYDAHSDRGELPYESEPADSQAFTSGYRGSFTGCDSRGRCSTNLLWWMNREGASFPEEDRRYVMSLYDAGLRSLDRALGDLFRGLEARGLLTESIVVLTSDHGEEFQEHGKLLHAQAYDESMRVPLLVRLPGPGGVRTSEAMVSLEDVAPTILDYCGSTPPPEMQGRSLRRLIAGEKNPFERSHVLMMDENGRMGLRTATWKLLATAVGWELYDLAQDPGERRNVMAGGRLPPEAEDLRRLLGEEEKRALTLRTRLGVKDTHGLSLTESEIETLRALGYLGN
jgi:arylsulfatase A-like enzyme